MVLVSWFKEVRSRASKEILGQAVAAVKPLRARLLQLLSDCDPTAPTPGSSLPYTELLRIYSKMRGEAGALIKHAEASGVSLVIAKEPSSSLEVMSAEAAIELAKKAGNGDGSKFDSSGDTKVVSSSDIFESSRQRLLATAGYLICVQVSAAFVDNSLLFTAFCLCSTVIFELS